MNLLDFASEEAARQGVDPSLVRRVIHQESRGNPKAVSPKGARGPMQLMEGTARDLGVNRDDPQDNIRGGVRYLKQQLDTFGSPRLALAAYNAGPAAVKRAGGVPNYRETKGYVGAIMGEKPQSGADIFGMDGPEASAGQNLGSGADIFADAPTVAPASAPAPLGAPQAPQSAKPDQQLGLLKGLLPAAEKLAPYSPANLIPGFRDANAAALGRLKMKISQREQTQRPGKIGEFAGNMLTTGWVPGGPMVSGAATGGLLSTKKDPMGVAGDMVAGAVGGKVGSSIVGGAGKMLQGVTDPAVKRLAAAGIPLTLGQMGGKVAKGIEDRATSIPIVGDVIRNAQRRGIEGANRAAFNDTLANVGEKLPDGVDIGHDAYVYTRQRLGDIYDEVLAPLTVARDTPFAQALTGAKTKIAKIGNPAVRSEALQILKTSVQSRFDKTGKMVGQDLKDAQSDLGSHINDLSQGKTWEKKAGAALKDVKVALEDLVSRTDPEAGERLAQVNAGWAHLKPLETATQKAGVKTAGVWNMNQLAQGVTKGKAASTVASGNAPHQQLASDAAKVLPSSVPDSGTAGRLMGPAVLAGLLSGHMPITAAAAPVAVPAAGLIGGMAALYTRAGQKALTKMMTSRNPAIRDLGKHVRLLASPAGTAGAVALTGAHQ
jgi:hypothetical protein